MIIIHISGSPGSGKSTLNQWVAEHTNQTEIQTVEIDDFINNEQSVVLEKISRMINDALKLNTKMLIFFGILSPSTDKIFEFPTKGKEYLVTKLWFVDEPNEKLLSQFYGRYMEFKKDTSFWVDVANGMNKIPSSEEWLSFHQYDINWHEKHHYQFMSIKDMKKTIITLSHEKHLTLKQCATCGNTESSCSDSLITKRTTSYKSQLTKDDLFIVTDIGRGGGGFGGGHGGGGFGGHGSPGGGFGGHP